MKALFILPLSANRGCHGNSSWGDSNEVKDQHSGQIMAPCQTVVDLPQIFPGLIAGRSEPNCERWECVEGESHCMGRQP